MRSSAIWGELGIEPLLLGSERSQIRWFGHLPGEVFRARPTGSRTKRPRTHWRDCVSWLAWERLGMNEVGGEREVWAYFRLLFSPASFQ